jgi:hypothetical protein
MTPLSRGKIFIIQHTHHLLPHSLFPLPYQLGIVNDHTFVWERSCQFMYSRGSWRTACLGKCGRGSVRTKGVHAQREAGFAVRAPFQRRQGEVIAVLIKFLLTILREHWFWNPPPTAPKNQSPKWHPEHVMQMELKCTIHAAVEGLLNGSRVGVNVATGPRDATDLNAIEEHWTKPIICHPNKGHRENTSSIGQGRTNGREIRHHEWFAMMWTKNMCKCYYFFWDHFIFSEQIWTKDRQHVLFEACFQSFYVSWAAKSCLWKALGCDSVRSQTNTQYKRA